MVEKEVAVRVKKASTVYQMLRRKIFRSQNLSKSNSYVNVFSTMVIPVLLYSAKTWPVMQKDIQKLTTFQKQSLQDILGLTLLGRCRNTDVQEECREATVRDKLRMKQLQWFGHVMRMPTH